MVPGGVVIDGSGVPVEGGVVLSVGGMEAAPGFDE
jgi:hypothetical protein